MFELLQPYLDNIITLVLGGFIGWFPNRKREEITNQQTIVDLYQDSLTDLKIRYEEKYQDLKSSFDQKFANVSAELEELKKSLDDWKKKYFNLKSDFEKYKKEHP